MGVEQIAENLYSCDAKHCHREQRSQSMPDDWGIINVFDDKYHDDVIGDQNGRNNYVLCPSHYFPIMKILGLKTFHMVNQVSEKYSGVSYDKCPDCPYVTEVPCNTRTTECFTDYPERKKNVPFDRSDDFSRDTGLT